MDVIPEKVKSPKYSDAYRQYQREYKRMHRKKNPEMYKIVRHKNHVSHRENRLKGMKDYRSKNKQSLKVKNKAWRQNNADWCKAYKESRIEIIRAAAKKYGYIHRDDRRRRESDRLKTDPKFALVKNMRCRVYQALRATKSRKCSKTKDMLGCDIDFLKGYIESKFLPGMTWENKGEWHIDHIIPCAKFDLIDPDQQRKCFHYSNLQPLWAKDNIEKSDKLPDTHQAQLL